jgi:UDP-glucose 4-epimerase
MQNIISYYSSKTILITGGLGFLGSNLAINLARMGSKVIIIDNMNPLYGGNLFNVQQVINDIEIIVDDVRNIGILKQLVEKADIIFHLAAQVSYIDSLNIPFEDLDLTAKATLNILELCRKYNNHAKIVFTSSRMVLGKVEGNIVNENAPTNPLSLYGIHKLTSEKYLKMYYKDFGIQGVILRLSNPYGLRQQVKHSKYSLVGWFVRQAMEGKIIKIFGTGEQLRDYIFSEDITNALIRCGFCQDAVGEVINLGSGLSTSFKSMVKNVVDIVGNGSYEITSWPKNYENIETGDISFDISKLIRITGWRPIYTLEDGIQRTFEYYRENLTYYL